MSIEQAVFLGTVQGLTEFLPVSSSGHLVIAQSFFEGFSQPGVLFDAVLHGGTILAVLWYFKKQLVRLDRRMLTLLFVGSIPAGVAGLLFKDFFESLFSNPGAVGFALLVTGTMNWLVDKRKNTTHTRQHTTKEMGILDSLVVGVFQAIAIIPGISRSGSTIFAGVFRGVKKEDAATFSFLLSIPAVSGAIFLQVVKNGQGNIDYLPYTVGFITAFIVGYFAIDFLFKVIKEHNFWVFALYCWIVGLTTLLFTLYH